MVEFEFQNKIFSKSHLLFYKKDIHVYLLLNVPGFLLVAFNYKFYTHLSKGFPKKISYQNDIIKDVFFHFYQKHVQNKIFNSNIYILIFG